MKTKSEIVESVEKTSYKLIYTANNEDVDGYLFENKEDAEKEALRLSLAQHEIEPDIVSEEGKIFIMDWLGYNKPYYGNNSRFVQYITVEEID